MRPTRSAPGLKAPARALPVVVDTLTDVKWPTRAATFTVALGATREVPLTGCETTAAASAASAEVVGVVGAACEVGGDAEGWWDEPPFVSRTAPAPARAPTRTTTANPSFQGRRRRPR